jgi:hypothetical protein
MKKLIYGTIVVGLLSITAIVNSSTSAAKNTMNVKCPLITLTSPPASILVGTAKPACNQTLTVSTNNCSPYTFTFTWSGGSKVLTTASGSNVLSFNSNAFPSVTPGTVITLVITDSGSNSSAPYYFTAVAC